jgi:hypothetical protein
MSEEQEPQDLPHEDELDVEGPNESAPGHNPAEDEEGQEQQQ